jgi:hypothetical protein
MIRSFAQVSSKLALDSEFGAIGMIHLQICTKCPELSAENLSAFLGQYLLKVEARRKSTASNGYQLRYIGIIPQDFILVKFHLVSQHRRSAQALSILGSSSAQLAHPLAQAAQVAQVLLSHLFLLLLQANHAS